jgi:hypothetical protein
MNVSRVFLIKEIFFINATEKLDFFGIVDDSIHSPFTASLILFTKITCMRLYI